MACFSLLVSPRLDSKVNPNTNYTPDADRKFRSPSFVIQAAGKSAPYVVVVGHPARHFFLPQHSQARRDSLIGELHPHGTGRAPYFLSHPLVMWFMYGLRKRKTELEDKNPGFPGKGAARGNHWTGKAEAQEGGTQQNCQLWYCSCIPFSLPQRVCQRFAS